MSFDTLNRTYSRNKLTCTRFGSDEGIWTPTASQKYATGTLYEPDDGSGRKFRYCKNAAVALTKGLMLQQAAAVTNWQNEVQTTGTAAAVGDKKITIYVATAPTANEWDDGYLIIQDGAGEANMYTIASHTVPASGTLVTVYIADAGGIRTATAVTSEVTVVKNLYRDVIVHPVTTATGIPVGVPLVDVTANYYFWAQTKGPCPMVVDAGDTITIGAPAGVPATSGTAGGAGVRQTTRLEWGKIMDIGAGGETGLVYLTLD